MKEWMCWVLLVIGVALLGWFAWWLTDVINNTMTVYYITVVLNGIVMCYNMIQEKK